ncbi:aminotransferase class III-fold pyridoxal phosphate-dependent enzyme [Streptomyces sp. NPDC046261]|uniref:aminotransferase class III-fold pyridoxal phosphate-dependent enzyme n=1 Tax=Streptomyces sp. NPDC046261 TaxID=3157200 RepID=UPI00340A11E8
MAPTRPPLRAPSVTPPPAHEGIARRQSSRESAARTYARSLPVVPVRARGLTIEGADGRRYLDCVSGAGTLTLGHNHPVVLEAIRRVLDSGAPLHALDLATPVEDDFTGELFATLPRGLADTARIRFCGPADTDATEAAFRLVRAATGREGLLAFSGACHGLPDSGAAWGTRATRLPFPQDYRCPFGVGGEAGEQLSVRWTETLLDDGAGEPAGLIVEPVQDGGGILPAPDGWLRGMREITAARAIPLIADETQTGAGRTGAFWAVEHSGIVPDVMVLSKAIGGSLPLAVVVHHEDLDTGRSGEPASTFRGNQLAMAAGAATLRHIRENALAERAGLLGARMLERLRPLAREHECVGEVRGRGLMIGIEFVDPLAEEGGAYDAGAGGYDPGAGDQGVCDPGLCGELDIAAMGTGRAAAALGPLSASPALAAAVQEECLRRGLIVAVGGRHSSVIRLLPSLTITDEQTEAVLDRLSDAIATVSRTARRIPTPRTPKATPKTPKPTPSTPKEEGAASPAGTP